MGVLQDFGNTFSSLAEVRFANWVTGPAGEFVFDGNQGGSLTSIYAPRLTGNPNLEVAIGGNPNLAEVDLCALIQAKSFVIFDNQILEQLSLPQLSTTNSLEVFDNGNLQTLCAPNLVDGGSVCIGDENDQPSLDADLSSLVTGSFSGFSDDCYGGTDPPEPPLNA